MPRILEQHGKDPSLTLLAFANPLLVLEKIGYSFTPEAKEEITAHVRFGKTGAATVQSLKEQLFAATGKPFDLRDAAALQQNLSAVLSRDDAKADKAKTRAAASGPQKLALPQAEIDVILDSVKKPVKVEGGKVNDGSFPCCSRIRGICCCNSFREEIFPFSIRSDLIGAKCMRYGCADDLGLGVTDQI